MHVIDIAGTEGRDPYDDFVKINEEVKSYNFKLENRPMIVVANKMDMPDAEENLKKFREQVGDNYPVYPISALTREGIKELLYAIADALDHSPEIEETLDEVEQTNERKVYRLEEKEEFWITRHNEAYVVNGEWIEKLVVMTNFTQYDSVKRFQRIMKQKGVDAALRKAGAQDGDTILIGEYSFDFTE